jgi:hypothetical protein
MWEKPSGKLGKDIAAQFDEMAAFMNAKSLVLEK